jgi:hypothetical protein
VVVRVQIAAVFRPRRWELENEKDSNIPIHAAPAEFWIVPPGYKRTVESPEKRLVRAFIFGEHELFLVAGWLSVWAGERDPHVNEKLVDTLIGNLESLDAQRQRLAQRFLEVATGKNYDKREQWDRWWQTLRGKTE